MSDSLSLVSNNKRKSRNFSISSFFSYLCKCCIREKIYKPRSITLGKQFLVTKFPSNAISNTKYNVITFLPKVLFYQFSKFLDFFFLIMSISQFFPSIRIGEIYNYWGPLIFIVSVSIIRELVDDLRRWKRDLEINNKRYYRVNRGGREFVKSSDLKVGNLIVVSKDERIPADVILVKTSEKNGQCFIRTDQLDGETDWKLRNAIDMTQNFQTDEMFFTNNVNIRFEIESPKKDIYSFAGSCHNVNDSTNQNITSLSTSLSIENTIWANSVLASGESICLVIYTGPETRAVLNNNRPRNKVGRLDRELNMITVILFLSVLILSFIMVALKGFSGLWFKYLWRFFLLFSYIIPMALRVCLDVSKVVSSLLIMRDKSIPGCIVRCTTIPEELARVYYLMCDKTGTLTQNDMVFRKLHLGSVSYSQETMDEVSRSVYQSTLSSSKSLDESQSKFRSSVGQRVTDAVLGIAICHNVTPMSDDSFSESHFEKEHVFSSNLDEQNVSSLHYQASSPDEVCLVTWAEQMGLTLISRDTNSMKLKTKHGTILSFEILQIFPFRSETKRMGIIVRDQENQTIRFYMKGADSVMLKIVRFHDWLEEEVGNMAREGLRTLVVGCKTLTEEQYKDFELRFIQAKLTLVDRLNRMDQVLSSLENDLDLLCLTGVEDKLQDEVRPVLEMLRNAGIKIWMLTGDKLETAESIAKSSRLISRSQTVYIFPEVTNRIETHTQLSNFRRHHESALIISGKSLEICLEYYESELVELIKGCSSVVVCRCSPTQKAIIVELLKDYTNQVIAAIGDGGNDVSMIQAADIGIGIVGKEGKQASLASDFSVTQFKHVGTLFLVHGRNSYINHSALCQFIIHRGAMIFVMQAIFSAIFFFVAIPLFPSILMVGYITFFTVLPAFSLILDEDMSSKLALTYPELYKDLHRGRELTYKTFFIWVLISIYQGSLIMYGGLLLFNDNFIHVMAITFTALILTELLMIAITIHTWHILMIIAEILSIFMYILAIILLKSYFDRAFVRSFDFVWKVAVITAISCIPIIILKIIRYKLRPPIYSKLN